ncbi:MAG TPA: hypothetical protein VMM56_08675 [Planctomycetaceae bacterium]|nr:hypothetical protein [Planctomycetaceae bacterium]
MKILGCCLSLVVCSTALPVFAFAQQTPPDTKSKPSVSEDQSKSDDEKTEEKSQNEKPIPEETKEERRERLRQNTIQGMGNPTSLLTIPRILRELQLSETQIKDVQQEQKMMRIQLQLMYRGVRDLPRGQQSLRMAELKPDADKFKAQGRTKILKLLTDEQRERLWGLSMQMRGPIALLDPEVAKLLELTDEQIEQIMVIAEEMDRELKAFAKRVSAPDALTNLPKGPVAGEQGYSAIRERAEQKMLEVLTEIQRKKYLELQGEELDFQQTESPTPVDSPSEPAEEKPKSPQ